MKSKPAALLEYYKQIKKIILQKQHPVTGLLPASTAITKHGNYTDAWVRDNVYSILCVWGLSVAMKKDGKYPAEQFELEQSTIRLMRGLLRSMMRQSSKVEKFKSSLALHDALHAKYDTATGTVVVADHEWGHLQIDATSLYMIFVAQMVKSGLPIITNNAEVDFIQNLVYYIERAYRTPDYGIWERGEKSNVGYVELNASSIGMAKSALTALAGFNLLGPYGSDLTTIHVIPDNIAFADITLQSLLPRESTTKEIDSALLSIVGFPAFAIKNQKLLDDVKESIRTKLGGEFGYKRFLRDGHQTVLEDPGRHYYNEEELQRFAGIECEWPLFYSYELVNAIFDQDPDAVEVFYQKIQNITVSEHDRALLPELYIVPLNKVKAEKKKPGSQRRVPNENIPLVWAQSLYFLGSMMRDGLMSTSELDPIGLHKKVNKIRVPIQVLILSETKSLQKLLDSHQIESQTVDDLPENTFVFLPSELASLYHQIGRNDTLELTGRPMRRLKSLTTSRLFAINDKVYICLSLFFLEREFYLTFDSKFLVDRFKKELAYIFRHWRSTEKPIVALMLTESLVDHALEDFKEFIDLLNEGAIDNIPVEIGSFVDLMKTSKIENLSELADHPVDHLEMKILTEKNQHLAFSEDSAPISNEMELEIEAEDQEEQVVNDLRTSSNIYRQIKLLDNLVLKFGLDHEVDLSGKVSLRTLTTEAYERAGRLRIWSVVRQAAALLGKVDIDLQFAVTSLLVQQKIIQVGKAFTDDSLIIKPLHFRELIEKINAYCRDDIRDRVLTQEVLVFLGILIRSNPELFKDLITIRVSYIILLLTGEVSRQGDLHQEDAYEELLRMPPSEIQALLKTILEKYTVAGQTLQNLESMQGILTSGAPLSWLEETVFPEPETPAEGWLVWRQSQGTFHIASELFYSKIWTLFKHAQGIIIGDKLDRRNRLESRVILADMTPGEKAFELKVEYLLNKIQAPEYRQVSMETILVSSSFADQNPGLFIDDYITLDVIIGHAVRLAFTEHYPELKQSYQDHKADAWTHFYKLPPSSTSAALVKAMIFLLRTVDQKAPEAEIYQD